MSESSLEESVVGRDALISQQVARERVSLHPDGIRIVYTSEKEHSGDTLETSYAAPMSLVPPLNT